MVHGNIMAYALVKKLYVLCLHIGMIITEKTVILPHTILRLSKFLIERNSFG